MVSAAETCHQLERPFAWLETLQAELDLYRCCDYELPTAAAAMVLYPV